MIMISNPGQFSTKLDVRRTIISYAMGKQFL